MTIRQSIRDALSKGPLSLKQLAEKTGHDVVSVKNACAYLNSEGYINRVKGQKIGVPNPLFESALITARPMESRLTSPAWVPPKPQHRPTYHAPGMVVREKLTGRELCAN